MSFNQLSRYLALGFSLLLVGLLIYYFTEIVAYILIAWVLAMLGQPIMRFFMRLKIGKFSLGPNLSSMFTLFSFLGILLLLIGIFVPPILQQAKNLSEVDYSKLAKSLDEPISDWEGWFREKGFTSELQNEVIDKPIDPVTPETPEISTSIIHIDSILLQNGDTITKTNIALSILVDDSKKSKELIKEQQEIENLKKEESVIDQIQRSLFSFFNPSQIPKLFGNLFGFLGSALMGLLSIFFIAFFLVKEEGLFSNFVIYFFPKKYESRLIKGIDEISNLLQRYFGGIAIQVTFITVFVSVLLYLFGLKNALLIGFFAALINVIPYVGPIIGALFGVFITLSSNLELPFYSEMLPLILIVIGVFAAMQMVDNFILQPRIFSKSVKAHPLEIFIVILMGAQLNGIVGMVLAIPLYTVMRVVARVFFSEFRLVQKITEGLNKNSA